LRPTLQAIILAVGAFLMSQGVFPQPQLHETPRYDGQWWLSITPKEQDGFVSGYLDCYTYEYKGPDKYNARSFSEYERLITEYYTNGASKHGMPITRVLHQFQDRPGEKAPPGDGLNRDQHGYFDGLYWKQISALGGKEKQVGFVEGYLSCHVNLSRNRGGVFSKARAEYVRLITQWYGLNEDTGDIDEKREPAKVADVLLKFRDHSPNHQRI
jgi:hypothetical protein